ncbi:conjugal transfer protein TraF [Shewanella algae]|uniref:conjugal transfer protein TraF n=1 Tax=Shewanella algae TaxID=38313 RepID=UPI003D7C8CF0
MKLSLLTLLTTGLASTLALAGQDVYEARSDAMGGVAVAAGNREAAAFSNPALLALPSRRSNDFSLLIPTIGADGADKDQMIDKFDALQDNYDALVNAIDAADTAAIDDYRKRLSGDLKSLQGNSAYVSVGINMALVMPSDGFNYAFVFKSYLDALGIAEIAAADIDALDNLDPNNPPEIQDLTSQGRVVAGAVSELGVAVSYPLSIVNMPVTVGVTPKLQRLDSFNYAVSANNFDADDFNDDDYRSDDTGFNLDIGLAFQPLDGLVIGVSGRNLIKRDLSSIEAGGVQLTYQVKPMVTAGVAYDWAAFSLSSDLDLTDNDKFAELEGSRYWRLGGEYRPADWVALRLGYRQDLNDHTADLYSLGTGFAIGNSFRLDLTGMFGSDDAIGGVLQTSYHF